MNRSRRYSSIRTRTVSRMLKALMRSKLASLLLIFRGRNGKKSTGKIIFTMLLFIYCIGVFVLMFGGVFSTLMPAAADSGAGWLVFTLYAMIAFSLMLIESIFATKSQLFEAKDNDLLLSMPIRPSYIVMSRLLFVYVLNLFTELLVFAPLCYNIIRGGFILPVVGWISFVISVFVLPLLATAVASMIGALLALITKRMRNKSLATVIFSLAFFAAYMYYFPKIMDIDPESLVDLRHVFDRIPPLYWFGSSVWTGNILHTVLSVLSAVIPFAAVDMILNASFIRLVSEGGGAKRIVYKEKTLKISSQNTALLHREFTRLGKMPMYLLNDSFGIIMTVAAGVAVLIFSAKISPVIKEITYNMPPHLTGSVLTLFGCAAGSMIMYTSPSVSLEGKTLWVMRSMPVTAWRFLSAKLLMHNIIAQPCILFSIVAISVALRINVTDAVLAWVAGAMFTVLMSEAGLLSDLRWPMLEWENETIPVKQNTATLVTMLIGFSLIIVPVLIVLFVLHEPDLLVVNIVYTALLAALAVAGYVITRKNAENMLGNIEK